MVSALFIFYISISESGVIDFMNMSSLGTYISTWNVFMPFKNEFIYAYESKCMYIHNGYGLTRSTS
jgi:hypothetical protein